MKFSTDILNAIYFTDGGFAEIVAEQHKKFLDGDGAALMTALLACSVYQELIPDWVADELLTLDVKIANNQIHDVNELFNFTPKHKGTLDKEHLARKMKDKILNELINHRLNGGNFTENDGLLEVSETLGVGRRIVSEVYKVNKQYCKGLPHSKEKNLTIVMA